MSVEQNLERNVDDVEDGQGDLVRHTPIQEVFAISFTRSPMQFVNVVFFVTSCGWRHVLEEQIDIRRNKMYLLAM